MRCLRPYGSGMTDDEDPPSRLRLLLGLAVIGLALWGGYELTQRMIRNSRVEDCLMAGRRNCAPIDQNGVVQAPK